MRTLSLGVQDDLYNYITDKAKQEKRTRVNYVQKVLLEDMEREYMRLKEKIRLDYKN